MDSVHPTQATKLAYGWIKTGGTLEVSTTASRTRLNLIGAIELNKINQATVAEYDVVNSDSIKDFFNRLRAQHASPGTINLILDQAGYHRSESVQKAATKLDIQLHYLPPYSTNLNPIERLWKVMNERVRNNRFFNSAREFRERIRIFFHETLPSIGHTMNDRINDTFQRLNHATSSITGILHCSRAKICL